MRRGIEGRSQEGSMRRWSLLALVALLAGSSSISWAATVAAGSRHSIALKVDGTVWTWGDNSSRQLGDQTRISHSVPEKVPGLEGMIAVAAGPEFSLAVDEAGVVYGWGQLPASWGGSSQPTDSIPSPRPLGGIGVVTAIAAGKGFILARQNDGTLWIWSSEGFGRGVSGARNVGGNWRQVSDRSGTEGLKNIVAIDANGEHALALGADGQVWEWWLPSGEWLLRRMGRSSGGELNSSQAVIVSVAAGNSAGYALTRDGSVLSWGSNALGQLGDGSASDRDEPARVLRAQDGSGLPPMVEIAAGGNRALAIDVDGRLWTWGADFDPGGSHQDSRVARRPRRVQQEFDGLPLGHVVAVASGPAHALAVSSELAGEGWAWGDNGVGQLGDGTTSGHQNAVEIASRGFTSMARRPVAEPPAGTYESPQVLSIASATPGATVRITMGMAPLDPDSTDKSLESGETLRIEDPGVVKATAWADGLAPSALLQTTYSYKVAVPTLRPNGGDFREAQAVTLNTSTPGAWITFTLDGREPTESSTRYAGPIPISTRTVLRARAFRGDWQPSEAASGAFTFRYGRLGPPVATPHSGDFESAVTVHLEAIPGATVHYTLDGSTPGTASAVAGPSILLESHSELRAVALHSDWESSPEVTETYSIHAATPELAIEEHTVDGFQLISVRSRTPGATIHFTLDGRDPTRDDPSVQDGHVYLGARSTLKARAFKPGVEQSAVAELPARTGDSPKFNPLDCRNGIASVSAGNRFSLLVKAGGTVWAWGFNMYGNLGDNTTIDRHSPVLVTGLTGVRAVSAGKYGHSLALRSDGTVWSWGANSGGQLGDGTTTDRHSPVQVQGLSGVVAISAGGWHNLALKDDGTVWAWGGNGYGQLGDGTTLTRLTPIWVNGLSGISSIETGEGFSLAIGSDGSTWAWGYNLYGQLGDGSNTQRLTPVHLGLLEIASASAGQFHSAWLLSNHLGMYVSGNNAHGQLGDGTTFNQNSPIAVSHLESLAEIAAGATHSLASRFDGSVWLWGGDQLTPRQVSGLPAPLQIAAGNGSFFIIDDECQLWGWGENVYGALGDGTTTNRDEPVRLTDPNLTWRVASPIFSPVPGTYPDDMSVQLSSQTSGATIHYTTDGTAPDGSSPVYTDWIPLTGTTTIKAIASKAGLPDSPVVSGVFTLQVAIPYASAVPGGTTSPQTVTLSDLTAGALIRYTLDGTEPTESSTLYSGPLVITHQTTLKAKGYRADRIPSFTLTVTYLATNGTLAAPLVSPGAATYLDSQSATITAEPEATIRYTLDGSTPTATSAIYTGPILIDRTTRILAKAFREGFTASSYADVTYTIKLSPPNIVPASGSFGAGQRATVASVATGTTIYYTISGSNPTTSDRTTVASPPLVLGNYTLKAIAVKSGCVNSDVASETYTVTGNVATGLPSTVPALAASTRTSYLLKPDGSVWAWGQNNYGQLGDGSTTQRTSPVQVSDPSGTGYLTGIQAIAPAPEYVIALASDGTVWAWGRNNYGQLGDSTTTQRTRPVQVKGPGGAGFLTDIVAIGANDIASVALKSDGTVWAWGDDAYGQLGQGTTTDSLTPVQVKGVGGAGFLTSVVAIASDDSFTLALRSDGLIFGWGYNGGGQLGDNTTTNRLTPVLVPGLTGMQSITNGSHGASFAFDSDGALWAWGRNRNGQLGDGTATQRKTAVLGAPVTNPILLGADGDYATSVGHALTLLQDGTLRSWGYNGYGQLGDNTTTDSYVLVQPLGLPELGGADAGGYHSLALGTDGSVWSWGLNTNGQLGMGNTASPALSPVEVFDPGFVLKVATPAFSSASGTYTSTLNITITTSTAGATIRYTLDGSEPTASSPSYSSPVPITASATLKARAFKSGLGDSNTAQAVYVLRVATPTLSPGTGTYITSRSVVVSCSVAGATLNYTTNGADPTPSDPTVTSGSSLLLEATATLKVRGWKAGWDDSAIASAVFTIKVAIPTLTPGAGSYSGPQTIAAATSTPGATVHYTLTGQPATEEDPVVPPGGIPVERSSTLNVAGFKAGVTPSDPVTASYSLSYGTVSAPSMSPPPGTFTSSQVVVLSSTTSDVTIRYTEDGTEPRFDSRVYAAPLQIVADTTLKARAFKKDWAPSATTTGAYTIDAGTVAAPTISLAGGRYTTAPGVTLASSTPDALIYYTTDGVDPTESSTLYSGPIPVTTSLILKARAYKSGLTPSAVRRADYYLTGMVVASYEHSLVLKTDGTVWAWGHNNFGQLGIGTTTDSLVPVQTSGLNDVVSIAGGAGYSLAFKRDGTVWTWGQSLGTTPVQVSSLSNIVQISADGAYRTAVSSTGAVWSWNSPTAAPTQVANLAGVAQSASGSAHRLAIKSDGSVSGMAWAWGTNSAGQVGDGTTTTRNSPVSTLDGVVQVAAGGSVSTALRADGTVWAWGANGNGQLGNGATTNRLSPTQVPLGFDVAVISASDYNLFALAKSGLLWATGKNSDGVLGTGTNLDQHFLVPVMSLSEVLLVDAGFAHVLAAEEDLSVWAWGRNQYGRLGNGTLNNSWVPIRVPNFWLGDNIWLVADSDGDGLSNHRELALETDALDADTNDDGIPDGEQVAAGQDPLDTDVDDDGVSNTDERINGTDLFDADSDDDGANDLLDCFPLDPTRTTCPPPVPGDTTAPVITLDEPTNAQLVSSIP